MKIVQTDLSGTMCNEQIPLAWILSYPLSISLVFRAALNLLLFEYKQRDPAFFYATLEGLPFVEHPEFIDYLTPNQNWDDTIADLKPKPDLVGIVTQDEEHIVREYLKTQQKRFRKLGIEVKIKATNRAIHRNGFYTGEAELNVTPEKLAHFASLGTIIGDGHISKALRDYPELKKNLIKV